MAERRCGGGGASHLATRRKSFVSETLLYILLGLFSRSALRTFFTSVTPFSASSSDTVLAFTSPEYLKELTPDTLLGSVVKRGPALPIPLRPGTLRLTAKHEVSRTIGHNSSADTFAMATCAAANAN